MWPRLNMDHTVISQLKNNQKSKSNQKLKSGFRGIIFHTNWKKTCEKFIYKFLITMEQF